MKPESKFWQLVKKNTPKIQWTRLESWASFGVPDLLGYMIIVVSYGRVKVVEQATKLGSHPIKSYST